MTAFASMSSPMCAVVGVVSRSTRTSAAPPSPMTWVWTWMPLGGGEGGLGLTGAGRVVAVGQEDDPLLGIVGEERGGEAHRAADVRGALDRHRRDRVELADLGRQALDERVLAERDDPRHVVVGHPDERSADVVEGLRPADLAHRIGQVHHEHRGQPIDRQDELEAGEGERSAARSRPRTRSDARRRNVPIRRREPRWRTSVRASRTGSRRRTSGSVKAMPTGQRSDRDDRPEPGRPASRRPGARAGRRGRAGRG